MIRALPGAMTALAVGGLLWIVFNGLAGVAEPSDAPTFGYAYAVALVLAAGLGLIFPQQGWLAGGLVVWAMLPVMIVQTGLGPLMLVGVLFLFLLSIPSAFLAFWMARLRRGTIARATR